MTTPTTTPAPTMATLTGLRIVADYQLFSDTEGVEWATRVLKEAQNRQLIDGFKVTDSHPGSYGIQFVRFTVDVPLTKDGTFQPDMSHDKLQAAAEAMLNMQIVHDNDVEVRWLSPIHSSDN